MSTGHLIITNAESLILDVRIARRASEEALKAWRKAVDTEESLKQEMHAARNAVDVAIAKLLELTEQFPEESINV